VGRYGGAQIVSLEPPNDAGANCLGTDGRPIHELLHALGIFHEQSRSDRDKFVKINFDNVIPRMSCLIMAITVVYLSRGTIFNYLPEFSEYRSNFDKQSLKNTTYQFEYDYDSVMHYGKNFFRYVK